MHNKRQIILSIIRIFGLCVGFAMSVTMFITILIATFLSQVPWRVIMDFNSLGEGSFEIFLFAFGMLTMAYALFYYLYLETKPGAGLAQ